MGFANRTKGIGHLHGTSQVRPSPGQLAGLRTQQLPRPFQLISPLVQLRLQPLQLTGPHLRLHPHPFQLHRLIFYSANQQSRHVVSWPIRNRGRDHRSGQGWRSQGGRIQPRMTQRDQQRTHRGRDVIGHCRRWWGRSHQGQGRHTLRKGDGGRGTAWWEGLGRRGAASQGPTKKLRHLRMTPSKLGQVLRPEEPSLYTKHPLRRSQRFVNIGKATFPTHVDGVEAGTYFFLHQ